MTCASIAVTLDRYRHLLEGIDDDLAKRSRQAQAQLMARPPVPSRIAAD
jgi:hypothetical protein